MTIYTPRNEECDESIDPAAKKWGHLATDVQDSEGCVAQCRDRFLAQSALALGDSTTRALCEALNGTAGRRAGGDLGFGWLYCCDSVLCGVWFAAEATEIEQDPNVKRIVYDCQNLGFKDVFSPRLPPHDFACPESSVYAPGERRACNKDVVGSTDLKESHLTVLATVPSSTPSPSPTVSGQEPGASPPSQSADLTSNQDDLQDDAPSDVQPGLSTGVKAAIGALSFLAFLAFLVLLLCVLRRRTASRTKYRQSIRERIKHASAPPPFDYSPTRLMPPPSSTASRPGTGARMSPPPRLKDRRILPAFAGGFGGSGGPGRKQPQRTRPSLPAFPMSPICAPTTSTLVPRNENAPLPPFSPTPTSGSPKPRSSSSLYSRSSGSFGAVAAAREDSPSREPPARPPRPHDGPLVIPDLVKPGPPTPALQPAGSIGVAVSQDGAAEGRNLVEQCARGRASWGSWGTRVVSPALGEEELERMGGKYTYHT